MIQMINKRFTTIYVSETLSWEKSASGIYILSIGVTIQMNKYFRCQKINTSISMQIASWMDYTD